MNYNKEQLDVINTKEDKAIVIATAGSGKTRSMVGAIQQYVKKHPTHKVSAITFTRKATAELNERIKHPNVVVSTIHAWCLRELNKLAARHCFKVEMLEDGEVQKILEKLCLDKGLYTVNQYFLFRFVMGAKNMDISDGLKNQYAKIERWYISHKRTNNLYDFTDLPLYLLDMLKKYNDLVVGYDALFVDEFQDVDPIQEELFQLTTASKKLYIGDPKQAIYLFRDAVPEIMEDMVKYNKFKELTLYNNYRSYQEILDFATIVWDTGPNSLLNIEEVKMEELSCKAPIAVRGTGGLVQCVGLGWIRDPIAGTTRELTHLQMKAILERKPYILCRSNKDLKDVQSTGYDLCSTIHVAKGLEYKDVIVMDWEMQGNSEEINIAYVACTRAKDTLTIMHYNSLMDGLRSIPINTKPKMLFGE